MLGDYNLQNTIDEILAYSTVEELYQLDLVRGQRETHENSLKVLMDVRGEGRLQCGGHIIVMGSVSGTESRMVTIETEGDVVVVGDANYAQISGRSVRIGGDAVSCMIQARMGVECGGDLQDGKLEIGSFTPEKREIDAIRERISETIRARDTRQNQLNLEQKRLYRHFETTRIALDFTAGQVIRKRHNRIDIDLRPFYKAIGNLPEEETDQALRAFYAKGVVGLLTRSNQSFLTQNVMRQRILKGVIRDFYNLFEETRKIDKYKQRIADLEKELRLAVERLNYRPSRVWIRGEISPALKLTLISPELEVSDLGDLFVDREVLVFSLRHESEDVFWCQCTYADGRVEDIDLEAEQLQDTSIGVFEGALTVGKAGRDIPTESLVV